jgi:tyrosyl-tRNA synthetase
VQKMSKSLGNYIGINEPAQEMFGKVMSISDELMWRYYELLTDLRTEEVRALRDAAASGERNPRDLKVDLARRIITDFHSKAEADAAEEEFNRIFKRKEMPEEIEERMVASGSWDLKQLLVETGLASSKAEARRLIEQGGVYVDGERCDPKVNQTLILIPDRSGFDITVGKSGGKSEYDIRVGKRRFLRVRGA